MPTPIILATSIINDTTTSHTATFPIATRANMALYELNGRYDSTFIAIPSIFISIKSVIKYTIIITSCMLPTLLLISSVLDTSAPNAPYINV